MAPTESDLIVRALNKFIENLPFALDDPKIGTSEWHAREDCEAATQAIIIATHSCYIKFQQSGTKLKDIMKILTGLNSLYDLRKLE